ncbi:MAG: BCCT family transporter [Marinicaulis sp.]|nr:BCCT family transporter [Marinicaulis sp.]NNL90494.1 BCCT family transporter [Marinicaulis sp.]
MGSVRGLVFWPPVVFLLSALAWSIADFDGFHAGVNDANRWILQNFDMAFSWASFGAVVLLAYVFFSPLGSVRIGGPDAKPILSRWNWFAITLCATIAIGILFWAAAEPMFHIKGPPSFSGAEPFSDQASVFALSSMFMHWTITPYALYSTPALAFALAYFNLGKSYSLSGPLSVVFGNAVSGRTGALIDAIGLYALVAGVAASLGAGVLTIAGGLGVSFGLEPTALLKFFIIVTIVLAFVVSSISGIQRGIKFLSDINIKVFIGLCAFVVVAGPFGDSIVLGGKAIVHYVTTFVPASLSLGERASDPWMRDWTVFYFANWLAWAPVTALFLGRISIGYTVREFLTVNLAAPAAFSGMWMIIFGGAAIALNAAEGGALVSALEKSGPETVVYTLFEALPFAGFVIAVFGVITFVSFVTAMDSNTHSIASLCMKNSSPSDESNPSNMSVKIFWGALVGAVAFVMTATTGIDGVRMLSNLGGLPGLFILIGAGASLIIMRLQLMATLANPKFT